MKVSFASLLVLLVLTVSAKADDPTFTKLLQDGWRIIAMTTDKQHKSCFLGNSTRCEPKDMEDSTVYSLTKQDGLAFCVGSFWWKVKSTEWVCEYTRIPGAAE
jgi:hypothetical protein